jgi:hypothetical protein
MKERINNALILFGLISIVSMFIFMAGGSLIIFPQLFMLITTILSIIYASVERNWRNNFTVSLWIFNCILWFFLIN